MMPSVSPLAGASHQTSTFQDISGSLSILVEVLMVIVNLFPLVVVFKWRRPEKRMATDELIVALSITDILSVLVPTPLGIVSYFSKNWYGGKPTCEFYQFTTISFQLAAMFLISCLCLDRLRQLNNALLSFQGHSSGSSSSRSWLLVAFVYAISFLVSSLPLMGLAPPAMPSSENLCKGWITSPPCNTRQHVFYVTFLAFGYLNFFAVAGVGGRLLCLIWISNSKMKTDATDSDTLRNAQQQTERTALIGLTWMVLANALLFYLTWFPALLMITLQKSGEKVSDVAILYALLSTSLSGLLNPLIYGLFSKFYRRGYRQIIMGFSRYFCGCCRREFQSIPASVRSHQVWTFGGAQTDLEPAVGPAKATYDQPQQTEFDNPGFEESNSQSEHGCFLKQTDPEQASHSSSIKWDTESESPGENYLRQQGSFTYSSSDDGTDESKTSQDLSSDADDDRDEKLVIIQESAM